MLVVLFSWVIIFFVFISYGDVLLSTYNRLCRRSEEYSLFNLFLLGIPSLLIVLSLLHFIIPINSYVLLVLCLSSCVYWASCRKRLFSIWERIENIFRSFSIVEIIGITLFTITILFITSWGVLNYDSGCYHYQSLRWIEDYPTVVGLGNIEERLGFNSNYFILSAPFSMRFILSEPLFALQGLLVVLMFIWIVREVVKSEYSFKSVFLLLLHILMIAINIMHFSDSSTDVLPNQIVFYLVAYLVLYSERLKSDYPLLVVLSVTILTFKLSLAVFALLALVVLIDIIKRKEYKVLTFVVVISFIICVLWLIRNVILSGYIVFPMYDIDLFSFDWKVPKEVAILEKGFIHAGAVWQLKNLYNNALTFFYAPEWRFIHTYFIAASYVTLAISVLYMAYLKAKHKVANEVFILYLILIVSIIASYVSAPDFRFTYGLVFGTLFIIIAIFADDFLKNVIVNKKVKCLTTSILALLLLLHLNVTFSGLSTSLNGATVAGIICKPRLYESKKVTDEELSHKKIHINNDVELYISNNANGFTMYQLPAVSDDITYRIGWRFQHYTNLEARGASLQDGFRTKDDK